MIRRESFITGFNWALGAVFLAVLLYFCWYLLQAVLAIATPFLAAIVVALLLDPLILLLQSRFTKGKRGPAVLIVFVGFLLCFLILIAFLVPTLIIQTGRLVTFFTPATYTIERSVTGGNWYTVAEGIAGDTYTVENLVNDNSYLFRVTATDHEGKNYPLDPTLATPRETKSLSLPEAPTPDSSAESPNSAVQSPTDTLQPGTALAVAGNRRVRLYWKQPKEIQSGFDKLLASVDTWLSEHQQIGPIKLPPNLKALQAQYSGQLSRAFQQAATRLGAVFADSVSRLLTIVLVPIATLYLLNDMPRLRLRFLYVLPRKTRQQFLQTANDIGGAFGSYFRGMLILSSLYAAVATVLYFLCGLREYALLLGFVAGVFYAVPFIGPTITLSLVLVVSLITGHTIVETGVILGLSFAQNFVFDNVMTPRVVGESVGLHPLTTMFSLFLGGQLFGFVGMLIAVPLAASIQVSLNRVFPKLGNKVPGRAVTFPKRKKPTPNTLPPETATPIPSPEPNSLNTP
jgi:predicted PurR-regulated permease PerM